jgi:pyruvate/2-oxoglutarate dehydrogenase complex dihydrolipoamide dehydrogenase (E3) component
MIKYDAIVIGSGQGGVPLAKKLAKANWKVALIERKWVGGTCINVGCTPTKTMISSGHVAHLVQRSADFGIHTNGFSVNMEEVLKRKNSVVMSFREGSTKGLLKTDNLDLLFGNAAFSGPKEITVVKEDGSREILTAEKIFINTGLRPLLPPVLGLDEINYLTSTSIMDLPEVPRHLVIIGGSYIALEFGQLYRRLGSEVTIIERGAQFLLREDEDIAAELKKILEEEGIHILVNTKVMEVASSGKEVQLKIDSGEGRRSITGSHVLVAAGREPDTTGLNTAVAGIGLDKNGFIQVNDKLETTVPGIYAIGDVKGGPAFTHISYNDHLIVYKNLVENGNESLTNRLLIYCMFTDPELGRVGLSEKQAREKGININVAKLSMSSVARGIETGETRGLLKAVVDASSRKIIGASILAPGGGELMSVLQMAILGGITYDVIRDTVFAHPTFAESLNNLFMTLDNE